ncbi:hypothetical protein OHO28_08540 [Streptomyces europaeiscabiei]
MDGHYDGANDRVVVQTDAPSSVTAPLLTTYPNQVVIKSASTPIASDS